jgi:hypothetical protein
MDRIRSMKWLGSLVALALAVGGCTSIVEPVPPQERDRPLFEVEYRNSAWGFAWHGFYVDGNGRVYSWDRSSGAADAVLGGDRLTPNELAQKYNSKQLLLTTLDPAEATRRYQQATLGIIAGLAEEKGGCADAGIMRFSVWIYDSGDNRFHRILLHQRGDVATTRLSPAAREVWKWLDEAVGGGSTICDPYA